MGDLELEVIVQEATFAEVRHHFLAFQLNQDPKVRTEVVPPSKHATFSENRFTFTVPKGLRRDVVIEDMLYLALFGVALKPEVGHLNRFVGGGSVSIHEIREELLQGGMAEVEVTLTRLLRREGTSVPVAVVRLQIRAMGDLRAAAGPGQGGAWQEQPIETLLPELRIHVFGAYGLPQDANGKSARPFVEMRLVHDSEARLGLDGVVVGKTVEAQVSTKTGATQWNETFIADVAEGLHGLSLRIQVVDERGDEDVVLGQRTLRLSPMQPHDCSPVFVELLTGEGQPANEPCVLLLALEYLPDGPLPSSLVLMSKQNLDLPPEADDVPIPTVALVSLEPRSLIKELGKHLLEEEEVTVPFAWVSADEEVSWGAAGSHHELGSRPKLLGAGEMSATGGRSLWDGAVVLPADEEMVEALEAEDPSDSPLLVVQWLAPMRAKDVVRRQAGQQQAVHFQIVGYCILELGKDSLTRVVDMEAMAVLRVPPPPSEKNQQQAEVGDGGVINNKGSKKKRADATINVVFGTSVRTSPVAANRKRRKRRRSRPEGEVTAVTTWEDLDLALDHDEIQDRMSRADPGISRVEMRVLALADQLAIKDATMEEMANELEQRAEAIRNCGTEILRVRKQKEDVDRALKEANSKLESVEREMERASTLIVCEDGQKLQRSSLEDLQRVLPVLVRRYHSVRVEKDKLLQAFQALSKEAKRMPGLKTEVVKLEKALLAQSAFIQTLQSRQTKVESYKTTIKMQEKVIHRLENLLEAKIKRVGTDDDGRPPKEDDQSPRGVTRGAAIEALKEEVRELRLENERLKDAVRMASEVAHAAKASRIAAVEEQLVEQSRASAKEISQLRMRIFELECGFDPQAQEEHRRKLEAAAAKEQRKAADLEFKKAWDQLGPVQPPMRAAPASPPDDRVYNAQWVPQQREAQQEVPPPPAPSWSK